MPPSYEQVSTQEKTVRRQHISGNGIAAGLWEWDTIGMANQAHRIGELTKGKPFEVRS
jgi:hypothetical protein